MMDIAKEKDFSVNVTTTASSTHTKSDPLGDGISSVELVRISGSDVDIVNAARVSFGKIATEVSERDEKLIRYLLKHQHTSPFEHNQLSFRIKTPIYIARQWMRHRMSSYNEISYRYVKSDLEFYVPTYWRGQAENNRQASVGAFKSPEVLEAYNKSLKEASDSYNMMLDAGVCREQARGVLPLCTYTEFIYTVNLHSFMYFLKLRMGKGAQWEIQAYAKAMLDIAEPHFKVALKAWRDFYLEQE